MMKSICALTRRMGMSRQEFQHYYEQQHVPLAIQYLPFNRYVRNHLLDHEGIGFDTISEFWAEDLNHVATISNGPARKLLRTDELQFMDPSQQAAGACEVQYLSTGPLLNQRWAILLNWSGDRSTVEDWVNSLIQANTLVPSDAEMTLDWIMQPSSFPARALLWTSDPFVTDNLPQSVSATALRVQREETDPSALIASLLLTRLDV
ncbi:EthD domain-containing protein [Aestuariicella hydrocarbonica]|uniref:EthD domain-containing protein n=1 Tax=Pseudomaricurvus hydrocarbonicus TaxID=1470433 RepID=A0A9E5JWE2_9GAMM|nr:EthD domain-containing protein [Aestuariicella hydrocarbonica]NHO66115.1 EthD domain-containing protein [Aestuariicella hydrocarbonica]